MEKEGRHLAPVLSSALLSSRFPSQLLLEEMMVMGGAKRADSWLLPCFVIPAFTLVPQAAVLLLELDLSTEGMLLTST